VLTDPDNSPRHALTIDVEDYFQVTAADAHIAREDWSAIPSRVEGSTERVLELLADANVRATFFVMGWVAEHYPAIVQAIDRAGHEIGSHSYWHRLVYRQTPAEFREDLRRSRQVLEDQLGRPITMYRAPTFSITRESLWALDILAAEGFTLDASIAPIRHDRYGIPDAPVEPHLRSTPHGALWEFPPTVARLGKMRLPIGGGGYFRLLPWPLLQALWRKAEGASPAPLMFYIHPWEFDPEQPRIPGLRRLNGWRHRVGLRKTAGKFARLLREFRFGAISDVLPAAEEHFGPAPARSDTPV
jgi:polysaccharide deacetylase family protein (PEP-CTERM system associated)